MKKKINLITSINNNKDIKWTGCNLLLISWINLVSIIFMHSVSAQLDIHVEDHTSLNRKMWPVTGGIPFPKGKIFDVNKVSVNNLPTQTRVLSKWDDGSIKWALLDYQTNIAADKKVFNQIVYDSKSNNGTRMTTETKSLITVNTGVLKFTINKSQFGFLSQVWLDLNKNGNYESDELIVENENGQDYFLDLQSNNPDRPTIPYAIRNLKTGVSRPIINNIPTVKSGSQWIRPEGGGKEIRKTVSKKTYSAKIIENGALRTVIQIKGRLGDSDDDSEYTIWVHAYKGKSFLRIQNNFMFRGDPQSTNIRRMGLKLPLNLKSISTFSASGLPNEETLNNNDKAYLFNTGPHDVFNLEYQGFPLNWEVGIGHKKFEGIEKTDGWVDVSSKKFGVTLALKDMAYTYPKELSYDAKSKSLIAWMWPDHGNLVLDLRASGWSDGMQGISFSNDIFYSFHQAGDQEQKGIFAKHINDTPQPYANPDWYGYEGTKAAGMIMPHNDSRFPKTEAYLATGTTFIDRSAVDFGWLGMLNYGDMMFMYAYHKEDRDIGTWGLSSRRDDYDGWRRGNTMMSYRKFVQYLRTGEYRYWKTASTHLKFVRDVLIKHYHGKDSSFVGFGRRHSAYWGITPRDEADRSGGVAWDGYGTNWLGHYMHWNLTGDWRTFEVIDEIRSAWLHWGNKDVDQLKGGAYIGLKIIGSIPGYEHTKKEANDFLISAIDRTSNRGDDWRDNTWFLGYGVYLQDEDDPIIVQAIMDWWKDSEKNIDQWGLYWHRESIAAAYWAAKSNKQIREDIYNNLIENGSIESQNSPRIEAQYQLYNKFGISGLYNCDMYTLANTVAPIYWRAKDDIMQQQWDEPLGMAVIDHYEKNKNHSITNSSMEKGKINIELDTSIKSNPIIKVALKQPSSFEIEVFNKFGEILWTYGEKKLKKGTIEIPTKSQIWSDDKTKGIYFITVTTSQDRLTKKIVLK